MTEQERNRLLEQRYLGVLGLLANLSPYVNQKIYEGEELHELIEDALRDAKELFPRLRVRRILNRFDVDFLEGGPGRCVSL